MTNEQLLIECIVKFAFNDYKKAIKKGFIYPQDINMLNPFSLHIPQNTYVECACDIIKDLTRSIVMYQYDIELLEKIFKKYDNELQNWFIHYYGATWVHPWDIVHNDMLEPLIHIDK